jgi:NADH-quinone oxidoreductase subunit M
LFSLSAFAFPGTNNFVGEIYVLIGTFSQHKTAGFLAVVGAVLAAAYMLRLLKQIVWGRVDKRVIADMKIREIIYLLPLMLLVLWMGIFPRPFVAVMEKSLSFLVTQMRTYY